MGLAGEDIALTLPPGPASAASAHATSALEDVIHDLTLYEPHLRVSSMYMLYVDAPGSRSSFLPQYLLDRALQTDFSESKLLDSLATVTILLLARNEGSGSKFVAYAARKAMSHLSASQGARECQERSSVSLLAAC